MHSVSQHNTLQLAGSSQQVPTCSFLFLCQRLTQVEKSQLCSVKLSNEPGPAHQASVGGYCDLKSPRRTVYVAVWHGGKCIRPGLCVNIDMGNFKYLSYDKIKKERK